MFKWKAGDHPPWSVGMKMPFFMFRESALSRLFCAFKQKEHKSIKLEGEYVEPEPWHCS